MSSNYRKRQEFFRESLLSQNPVIIEGDVDLCVIFKFIKKGIGDIDNLYGGVLDAAQGFLFENDRQILSGSFRIERYSGVEEIIIDISEAI